MAVFALANVGFAVSLETALPQVRDPEYGYRLVRVREQQRLHPNRPLVLVLGTSRTQNAIDPNAMTFPDRAGSPLVFNGGTAGASLVHLRLNLQRFLADGVKPAAVLVELFPATLHVPAPADPLFSDSANRLTAADLKRLEPYLADPRSLWRNWAESRLNPWHSQRIVIVSHMMPDWQPWQHQVSFQWTATDHLGFGPYPMDEVTDEYRARKQAAVRTQYADTVAGLRVSPLTDRAIRDLIADCRENGIPLAFFFTPESPNFRSWYTPQSRAALEAYMRRLTVEFGYPVFESPGDFGEDDFADGHHILRPAAQRFSRWLADTHLKPWLAEVLK